MFLDYYQVLGLKKTANADEIRLSFRTLAHKYHPDKNGDSLESAVIFRSIHEAYRILSSADLKNNYDNYLRTSTIVKTEEKEYSRSKNRVETTLENLCSQLNFILWEVEDLFSMKKIDFNGVRYSGLTIKEWLLNILYFMDKWVLTPAGYGDYFYQARQIDGLQEYSSVPGGFSLPGHNPYTSFTDYFFQLRKRMDRMINQIQLSDLSRKLPQSSIVLSDSIYESLNYSYHYLGALKSVLNGRDDGIADFIHSNIIFNEGINGVLN